MCTSDNHYNKFGYPKPKSASSKYPVISIVSLLEKYSKSYCACKLKIWVCFLCHYCGFFFLQGKRSSELQIQTIAPIAALMAKFV